MLPYIRPLVSVIIPFLNPGKWLSEAVNSVLKQTYTNWEIILIDDGSAQKDSNAAKEYALKYPEKIKYVEHSGHLNRGVTISRNYGISFSKGDYIGFLDADDYWLPEKLSNQVELFEQYPQAAMICEASRFWYSWSDPKRKDQHIKIGVEPGLYQPCELTKKLYPIGTGQPPCPSGMMIKREAFDRRGGFEESFTGVYQLYEDQAFLAKIYLFEKIYISDKANNLYRKRIDSMSSGAKDDTLYRQVRQFFFTWLENYIISHPVMDDEVLQLLTTRIDSLNHKSGIRL